MVFSPFTLKLRELNEALKTSCGHVPGVRRVTSPPWGGGGVTPLYKLYTGAKDSKDMGGAKVYGF